MHTHGSLARENTWSAMQIAPPRSFVSYVVVAARSQPSSATPHHPRPPTVILGRAQRDPRTQDSDGETLQRSSLRAVQVAAAADVLQPYFISTLGPRISRSLPLGRALRADPRGCPRMTVRDEVEIMEYRASRRALSALD